LEIWLQPLRAYPRGFVLACFILTVGALVWIIAKICKWSVYLAAFIMLAVATGAFALWLWV
jgi:heme/copper-type cytochrome/quinol oxidase subunit 4